MHRNATDWIGNWGKEKKQFSYYCCGLKRVFGVPNETVLRYSINPQK